MKKLFLFFVLTAFISCSSEDSVENVQSSKDSFVENGVLVFKDEESFVKEYSHLSSLNSDEIKKWSSSKKMTSLLSVSNTSEDIEEDEIVSSRLVYSNVLLTLLNSESKIKIGNKILWLHERNFYLLDENQASSKNEELILVKDNLGVYGQLLNVQPSNENLTNKDAIPNQNRTKTFESAEFNVSGSRLRHVVDLFNETIVINDKLQSSKMFIRSRLYYRSCSTFRCTWKEAMNSRYITTNLVNPAYTDGSVAPWQMNNITASGITGTQTFLLASWSQHYMLADPHANFAASGPVTCTVSTGTVSVNLSWY